MKKVYVTPIAKKFEFDYTETVVASPGGSPTGFGCMPMTVSGYSGMSQEPYCHKYVQSINGDM